MNAAGWRRRAAIWSIASSLVVAGCSSSDGDGDGDGEPAPTLGVTTDVASTDAVSIEVASTDVAVTDVAVTAAGEDVPATEKDIVTRSFDGDGDGTRPDGFGSVTARVTSVDGEVCEVCLWLADTDPLRQRGLMGVTDLGDAVGMAFRWDQPRSGNFFMFQTPTPLSIAWFDAAGSHVGQADMEPCMVDNSAECERYTSDAPYVLAVEMFGDQLGAIGIGAGASIELLDLPCV